MVTIFIKAPFNLKTQKIRINPKKNLKRSVQIFLGLAPAGNLRIRSFWVGDEQMPVRHLEVLPDETIVLSNDDSDFGTSETFNLTVELSKVANHEIVGTLKITNLSQSKEQFSNTITDHRLLAEKASLKLKLYKVVRKVVQISK